MFRQLLRSSLAILVLLAVMPPGSGAPEDPYARALFDLDAGRPSLQPAGDGESVVPVIEGFGHTSRAGAPMLPLRVLMVAIPEGAVPELRILGFRVEPLGRIDVAPVARFERGDPGGSADPRRVLQRDASIFGADAEFPGAPVRLGRIGYLREQRFVELLHTPLLVNPRSGQARLVSEMRVAVEFNVDAMRQGGQRGGGAGFRPDPLFEDLYRRSLANYEQGTLFRSGAGEGEDAVPLPTASSLAPLAAPGTPRYKMSVSRAGVYRLDHAWMLANAPDLLTHDACLLTVSAEGTPVPVSFRDAAGGAGDDDCRFDTGDLVEFYGQPKTEPASIPSVEFTDPLLADIHQANDFTDTKIYWLEVAADSASASPRIPGRGGVPGGFPLAPHFEEAAVWEEPNPSNRLYFPSEPMLLVEPTRPLDPFVSMPSLLAGSTQAQRDLTLALPGLAAATGTARVVVRMVGGSSIEEIAPDHLVRAWINGNTSGAADGTWDGETPFEHVFTVAHPVLTNPVTIHLSAPGQPGVPVDRQYPDVVTIRYRRLFAAQGDVLAFTYPNQDARFQVSGLSGNPPVIYEVTRLVSGSAEADPVRITGATCSGSPTLTCGFQVTRDTSAGAPAVRSFIVAGPAGVTAPDAVVRAADPVLRDPANAADLIVIGARATLNASPAGEPSGALQALLDHRLAARGLTSRVVFIDQVYDEFSFGQRDANAIRAFLSYAFDNWRGGGSAPPPSFVLLVGDATPDYKNFMGRVDWVDQVPTPVMWARNSTLGYYSSDNRLASFRGPDQIPDVLLGRISARSVIESEGVFDKIRRYEQSPPAGLWKGRGLMVAGGGKDSGEATQFEGIVQEIGDRYFTAAPYSKPNPPLYFSRPPWGTDAAAFKTALLGEFGAGAGFLYYVGHGGFDLWGTGFTDPLLETADAAAMTNDGLLPFVVTVNCLSGGFHYFLGTGAIGETLVNNPRGGAIATLAPAGLSSAFFGPPVNNALFHPLLGPFEERLVGAAAAGLNTHLWTRGSFLDAQAFTLLGDPATRLATPAPEPPLGVTATAGNGEVSLYWTPPASPAAGYRVYRAPLPATGVVPTVACDPVAQVLENCVPVPYLPVTCEPTGAGSCADRSVVNATTYYYYLVSLDTDGFEGRASNFNTGCDGGPDCVTARPVNPGPPAPPTGLTARDAGTGGRLEVSWLPGPESDIKQYTLYYGTEPSPPYAAQLKVNPGATSATLTGLEDGRLYYMAVTATNTSGHESGFSAQATGVPHLIQGIAPPRAITDLRVAPAGSDLVLSWSAPTTDIYGRPTTVARYDVYRGGTPGFRPFDAGPVATILNPSTTTWRDTGANLAAAGNLFYVVTATDNFGFTSGAGHDLPNGIQALLVTSPSPGIARLTWPAVTTDVQGLPTLISHYQVHRSDRPLARGTLDSSTIVMDNVTVLSVDLQAPGSLLYFSVIAVDNRGNLSPF
jgi:hypothetical protein